MTPVGTPSEAIAYSVAGPDDSWLPGALATMEIVGTYTQFAAAPLPGGVSSDIYRVDLPAGVTICIKRALARLKVAADWRAPVSRNRWEAEWMRVAGSIAPSSVPKILGEDRDAGCFAMEFFPPDRFSTWKSKLAGGDIDADEASRVGDILGRIHAATADRDDIAARFATDDIFYDIRLEPYLVATARTHPELAPTLSSLVETTRNTRRTLVHGDFSPKNILCGSADRAGPVIVDAECAWYGDPAFDLAFVLNHLLLKGAWQPQWKPQYHDAFRALASAYLAQVGWEDADRVEARAAALLPALMLARIDGKSPVEYIIELAVKERVRTFARGFLMQPSTRLADVAVRWTEGKDR